MAERILSNELKALSKEPWVNIQVRLCSAHAQSLLFGFRDLPLVWVLTRYVAQRRELVPLEHRSDCAESGISLLWRLF